MDLLDEIKNRLSLFKNFYDVVRVVDPVNKKASAVTENKILDLDSTCYALWRRDSICENCVSMRACANHDTFVKIEYDRERVILIIATPVVSDGKTYIVEILKDITENSSVFHKITEESTFVEELISSINEKAVRDELTGIYNRRYINERLPVDINNSKINELPFSIIMTDIDFFKKVNDNYGHVVGDKVLCDFANLILKSTRHYTDWIGRYGGEEFLIVLNGTDLKNAYNVAEKIRKQIENTTFEYDDISVNITSSFGVYGITDNDIEVSELLSKVDGNLYEAKKRGRNRTVASEGNASVDNLIYINEKEFKLVKLKNQINELRETLNEVCCTIDEDKPCPDRLLISQCLDELIVKYMKELND